MPAGKRLAPMLRRVDAGAAPTRRVGDRRRHRGAAERRCRRPPSTAGWPPERKQLPAPGRSHTKPGSLLKTQIPIRTWADWDDALPGFVEIDLVGHEGGNAVGEHAYTLTVTDIATGWTENRSVRNKARKWVIAALEDIEKSMPFPLLGIRQKSVGVRQPSRS